MVRIDARGMRCPWPAMRLARALRGDERRIEVIADDPAAAVELAAVAANAGAEMSIIPDQVSATFVVTRTSDGNIVFT